MEVYIDDALFMVGSYSINLQYIWPHGHKIQIILTLCLRSVKSQKVRMGGGGHVSCDMVT